MAPDLAAAAHVRDPVSVSSSSMPRLIPDSSKDDLRACAMYTDVNGMLIYINPIIPRSVWYSCHVCALSRRRRNNKDKTVCLPLFLTLSLYTHIYIYIYIYICTYINGRRRSSWVVRVRTATGRDGRSPPAKRIFASYVTHPYTPPVNQLTNQSINQNWRVRCTFCVYKYLTLTTSRLYDISGLDQCLPHGSVWSRCCHTFCL